MLRRSRYPSLVWSATAALFVVLPSRSGVSALYCPARGLIRSACIRRGIMAQAVPGGRKAKRKKDTIDDASPPDPKWRARYDLILELRNDRSAVVDSMGAEALALTEDVDEITRHYQTLISLMLSSQTKDTVTAATMVKLREHGLTIENILATPDDTLNELIRAVGFHNNKTKFIKQATQKIVDEFAGKVPDTLEGLSSLPGVGPKMALIVLRVNNDIVAGIAVDTHVHRICNQLAWTKPGGTKQPEQTRKAIEAWMPKEIWPDVNLLLVGLGQEIQTEQKKIISKAIKSSDPHAALDLLHTLGLNVSKYMSQYKKKTKRADSPSSPRDDQFERLLDSISDHSLKTRLALTSADDVNLLQSSTDTFIEKTTLYPSAATPIKKRRRSSTRKDNGSSSSAS